MGCRKILHVRSGFVRQTVTMSETQSYAGGASPDTSRRGSASYNFVGIDYLNDECESDKLRFPRVDTVVRPAARVLLVFTGRRHHEHAVLRGPPGPRATMPAYRTPTPANRIAPFPRLEPVGQAGSRAPPGPRGNVGKIYTLDFVNSGPALESIDYAYGMVLA
jgi:hypothetical protein